MEMQPPNTVRVFTACELRPVTDRIVEFPELRQDRVFDDGFVDRR